MKSLVACLLSGVFAASQPLASPSLASQSKNQFEQSISGPFPILSVPYEEDGSLDLETLVREARFVGSTGVNGFIWAQSNDAVDLLTIEEKKASFTALAKAFAGSPTYVVLGCQGRDTADMEALARHVEELAAAYPTTRMLIACRPPLDARSQDDLERYYRRLAEIAHRPVIIQTYAADDVPNPSSELLIRLARERPDIFGWIKEETGEADADMRMKTECAAPEVKTVFSAWGSWGWVRQHRLFGTRGVISERAAYAAELLEVWRALQAKDDARADAIWAKYTDMLRLKKILPGGEHRNFSLHVLNRLGVFKNMVSREYADEKKTPGRWKLSTRTFTQSEIAEIERRWAALRAAATLPTPRPLNPSIDVIAIYYPHWHAYPKGDEWFHKGFNEWEFCRTARKLFPGHRVPIEPLFGYIDESKPENVEKEIALAANAGITVFMYDWYWYDGQMTMQEALEQGFLKAKNRDRLKFCLMWCYHDRADPFRTDPRKPMRTLMPLARTEDEFLGCIRYATERFFREPNHWMRDGRPFFSIYNAPAFLKDRGGAAGTRQALDKARAIARAAGFKGICFQAMGPNGLKGAEELAAAGFDVLGDYGLSQGLVPEARRACKDGSIFYDYGSTCPPAHRKRWNEIRRAPVPYIPGVSAGRDASPRCRLDEPFPWKKIAYPYDGIATNNTPEAFGRILEMAKETVLADPKKPGAVLIYGWNEYTEGGYIAPTRLNGDGHLKAVSRVFAPQPLNPTTPQPFNPSPRFGGLYGPEETAVLSLTNASPADTLLITDAFGNQILKRALTAAEVASGKVTLTRRDLGGRFGCFSASAVAQGSVESPLPQSFCFLTSNAVEPVHWVGTVTHDGHGWGKGDCRFVDILAQAGIGCVRDEPKWAACERSKGEYALPPAFDRYVNALCAKGIKLNLLLDYTNGIYENPVDPDGFAAWAAWMGTALKGRVDRFEIWNEPGNFHFRRIYGGSRFGDSPWVRAFVAFTRRADDALHAVRPDALISVCAEDAESTLEAMIGHGIARAHNAVAFHPYCHAQMRPEREMWFQDGGRRLRELMAANGGAMKVAATEMGWTTFSRGAAGGEKWELAGGYQPATLLQQASCLVRAFVMARQTGVEFACQYDFKDDGPRRNYTEHNFGLVRQDFSSKPAMAAVAQLTRLVGMAKPLGDIAAEPSRFRVYRFRRPGDCDLFCCWAIEGEDGFELPPAQDLAALRAYDIFGNRTEVPLKGRCLRLNETPLYLTGLNVAAVLSTPQPLNPSTPQPFNPSTLKTVLADWEFQRDGSGPFVPVRVPHDWAIAGEFDPDATRYPDAKLFCGYAFTGKLPWRGTGLYRRRFLLTERQRYMLQRGGRVLFEFDGVMANPEVRVNGVRVGGWDYGYMGFAADATDALNWVGENVVEVFATTKWHGARWHPGGGIYREARMVTSWANRVKPGTLKITPSQPFNPSNRIEVCIAYEQLSGAPGERTLTIENPRLWSVDDPFLYSVDIAGEEFRYGIRTIDWTANDGFHLNGRRLQIRGVNLHADLGPLGMAFDVDAARRQLAIMKDMGVNAIRTSHNPPAPQFLDLCDEMGFVVWDECFDKWNDLSGMRPDQNLEEYVTRNLEQFVRRDRNHPCVVCWSIGNEIKPASPDYPEGMTKARCAAFRAAIRRLDATRPVAAGSDSLELLKTGALEPLDLQGWNYARRYAAAHAKYPNVPVVASETASALSSGGYYSNPPSPGRVAYAIAAREVDSYDHNSAIWSDIPDWEFERLEQDRYCAGEFVWTGIDYIGEPTPYAKRGILHFDWLKAIPERELARSSYFGAVDLCGIPKDRFYLYRAHWRPEQPTVHVLPHWNWPGHEGRNVPVYVYSNGDEAELFLNGRSLGRRKKATGSFAADFREGRLDSDDFRTNGYYAVCDKYRFRWLDVAYEPGEVKAVCYRGGRKVGEGVVRTAGPAAGLRLVRDPYSAADARTIFVRVEAVDGMGVVQPLSAERISFAVFGDGELVAVGNGNARDYESFGQTGSHRLYYGRCVAVVRRRGNGRLVVRASGVSLGTAELTL